VSLFGPGISPRLKGFSDRKPSALLPFHPALVAPEWGWFWDSAVWVVPFWEIGGQPRDLKRNTFPILTSHKVVGGRQPTLWSSGSLGAAGEADEITDHWLFLDGAEASAAIDYPLSNTTMAVIVEKTDGTDRNSGTFGANAAAMVGTERCSINLPWGDGNYYWDFGGFSSGTTRLIISSPSTTGIRRVVMRAGARGMAVWQDGVELGSHATANPGRTGLNADQTPALNHGADTDDGDLAKYYFWGCFNSEWTDAQILQWSRDPFGPFRTQSLPLFLPSVADSFDVAQMLSPTPRWDNRMRFY